jgi:DNA-directed RNA polymerase subunit alpha
MIPGSIAIDEQTLSDSYGKFIMEPLERGYGQTIGNAMRRVLLSSLEGAAPAIVKIEGAPHEFAVLSGVREDVSDILLNLRKVRFRLDHGDSVWVEINEKGRKEVHASDINCPEQVRVVNPDAYLATLESTGHLKMQIEVSRGRGYVPAEQVGAGKSQIGEIVLDALYSPIVRVKYDVDNARVGQVTNYDRLTMEVWTDTTVPPVDAVSRAATILGEFIEIVKRSGKPAESAEDIIAGEEKKEFDEVPLKELSLSPRVLHALEKEKIRTIGDLLRISMAELTNIRNFGGQSLKGLQDKLAAYGKKRKKTVEIGMLSKE